MDEDLNIVFASFCDENKILKYFKDFREFLESTENVISLSKINTFSRFMRILEKNDLFDVLQSTSIGNANDEKRQNFNKDFNNTLLDIVEIFCVKHFKIILQFHDDLPNYTERAVTLDTIAYLIKKYIDNIKKRFYIESLIENVCCFLTNVKLKLENYTLISESELAPLYFTALKFMAKVFQCISIDYADYFSENSILLLFASLPFTDPNTVKLFVNHILPAVIKFSQVSFKVQIFKSLWQEICLQFNINEERVEEEASDTYSCIYTLLCCLSESLYSTQSLNIQIHEDLIFWRIIMSGLTSNFPFTRKKALNVYKMFLAWINTDAVLNDELILSQSMCFKFRKDLKIWNDMVTLFESLEEKQIHVIKPVLPKFSRILLLTTKDNGALPCEKCHDFPSSCLLTALLSRMLKHETKFVVKWALSTVLTLDFKVYLLNKNDDWLWLIKYLLQAFNDQTLYSRNNEQDNYSLFLSSEKISLFFKNYISSLESSKEKVSFMNNLLMVVASQSWCHVALLHLIYALTELESLSSWSQCDLKFIRKIVLDCQRSQEPVFRTALEYFLLESCSLFLDWHAFSCGDIAELLSIFKSTAVLRHSRPWERFAAKFKANIFIDSNSHKDKVTTSAASEFCIQSVKKICISESSSVDIEELEIEKVARMVLMLADIGIISPTNTTTDGLNWGLLLKPVLVTLQLASKRPYMNSKDFLSSVKLISLLIKESYGSQELEKDLHTSSIIQCLQNCPEMVEFMYQKLFIDIENSSYISQNNIIFEAFGYLTCEIKLKGYFSNMISVLSKKVEDLLEDVHHRKYLLFPLWRMLNNIVFLADFDRQENKSKLHQHPLSLLNYKVISKVTNDGILLECLSKLPCLDSVEKEQWLQFSYNAVCCFWEVTSSTIHYLKTCELSNVALLLAEEAKKIFDNGPKVAVPYAINCMKSLVPKLGLQDLYVMSDLLEASWVACLELRGNEAFRPSLTSFIEVIFQTEMLKDIFFNTLYKYIERFKELSENTIGIFYIVTQKFCNSFTITNLTHSKFDCIQFIVYALTFGPIHQKAHKIMEETLIYLIERDSDFANSLALFENSKPSSYVRIIITNYLLKNLRKENEEFSFALVNQLLKVDIDENGKQSSHFANSFSHRIRNRAWQGILLLQPYIKSEDLNEQLLMKTLDTLGVENQQPSIRYLQEWVIFNIVQTHQNLLNKYILLFEQSLEKRPSYIISVLSVTNLLILHHVLVNERIILKCFKLVTVLCMAQNFTVRLYAQMALTNLFSLCQEEKLGSAILQYEFVLQLMEMQKSLAGQGNFLKNVIKLSSDFYFSCFKPNTHFTIETIFYELPRLSNLCPDEWIKPSLFSENCLNVDIFNPNDDLKNSVPTSWSYKSVNETPTTEGNSLDYNFQKKIIPIKDMLHDFEGLNLVDNTRKKSCKDGLIVVASLIDRIPNLGGLCRTCEVFAVSEFVIGNLRYTEDKQFQTLAVSADKWVSIKEVKTHQLKDYLTSMKEKGYVLIGAEQTEDSCTLNKYTFPKKSVLLLGHEKEGLPVDLIQLLDVCVEIPQQGVVRSLNVHVSGAILIWEYARQHIKPT